jgi:ankyrin repeat protein
VRKVDLETCRAFVDATAISMHSLSSSRGNSLLYTAAKRNQVDVCALLLQRRANPDAVTNKGWTALMVAARRGKCDVMRLLLQSGARVAARRGNCDAIRLLPQTGAKGHLRRGGARGYTALHHAVRCKRRAACVLLLNAKASVHMRTTDSSGLLPLELAVAKQHTTIVQLLRDWPTADAFAVEARRVHNSWRTAPPSHYCWIDSKLFDINLLDEITIFVL